MATLLHNISKTKTVKGAKTNAVQFIFRTSYGVREDIGNPKNLKEAKKAIQALGYDSFFYIKNTITANTVGLNPKVSTNSKESRVVLR